MALPHPQGTSHELRERRSPWLVRALWGAGCLTLALCAAAILLPVFMSARVAAETTTCRTNLKDAATGLMLYGADYGDRLPPASVWREASLPYLGSPPTRCPKVHQTDTYGYAMSRQLAGARYDQIEIPSKTVLLFESALPGVNASGDSSRESATRHGSGFYWAAADGMVRHQRSRP